MITFIQPRGVLMTNFQDLGKWIDTHPGKAVLACIALWFLFSYGDEFLEGFIAGLLVIQ